MMKHGQLADFRLRDAGEVVEKLQEMYRSTITGAIVRYEHILEGLIELFRHMEGYNKVGGSGGRQG